MCTSLAILGVEADKNLSLRFAHVPQQQIFFLNMTASESAGKDIGAVGGFFSHT